MQSKEISITFVRIDLLKERASAEALSFFMDPQLAETLEQSLCTLLAWVLHIL